MSKLPAYHNCQPIFSYISSLIIVPNAPFSQSLSHILLALPIGTATVSEMKMIKTRLRNRLSDCNLSNLMKIAVEGPQLESVCFEEIFRCF